MDDYLEFMQWMQQRYPNELGQGQGFGMQGQGFGMQGGGMVGGLGDTMQFAASSVPKIQTANNLAKSAAGAGEKAGAVMNPWLSVGMYGGGALLKALMGDPMEKYRKTGLNAAQKTLKTNPDVLNVGGAIGRNRAAMVPQLGRMGEQTNKRFGLDTGVGQYANIQALLEKEGMFNLNASMENDSLKSRRNQGLMGLLAGAR